MLATGSGICVHLGCELHACAHHVLPNVQQRRENIPNMGNVYVPCLLLTRFSKLEVSYSRAIPLFLFMPRHVPIGAHVYAVHITAITPRAGRAIYSSHNCIAG